MSGMRFWGKPVLLALLLAAASACAVLQRLGSDGGKPTVLTSPDGRFQLTIPAGWRQETELNEQAGIQGSNRSREMYIVLITDSRSDFSPEISLAQFTSVTRDSMKREIRPVEATEPTQTTVNGNSALQYEVRGAVEGVNAVYIITTVETSEHYHQIITWTLSSRFEQQKGTLREVSLSFKDVGTAIPTANSPAASGPSASAPSGDKSAAPKQVP